MGKILNDSKLYGKCSNSIKIEDIYDTNLTKIFIDKNTNLFVLNFNSKVSNLIMQTTMVNKNLIIYLFLSHLFSTTNKNMHFP